MEAVCSIDQPAAESSIYILFTTLSALLLVALFVFCLQPFLLYCSRLRWLLLWKGWAGGCRQYDESDLLALPTCWGDMDIVILSDGRSAAPSAVTGTFATHACGGSLQGRARANMPPRD